jgi:hypothetical protein
MASLLYKGVLRGQKGAGIFGKQQCQCFFALTRKLHRINDQRQDDDEEQFT